MAKGGRYKNFKELQIALEDVNREAMELTYQQLNDKLHEFLIESLYGENTILHQSEEVGDTVEPTWYKRTNIFMKENPYEYEVYYSRNQYGRRVYGRIIPKDKTFRHSKRNNDFSHGNPTRKLKYSEFLNILTKKQEPTAFGFPMVQRPYYWTDFYKWAKAHIKTMYEDNLFKVLNRGGLDITK